MQVVQLAVFMTVSNLVLFKLQYVVNNQINYYFCTICGCDALQLN